MNGVHLLGIVDANRALRVVERRRDVMQGITELADPLESPPPQSTQVERALSAI